MAAHTEGVGPVVEPLHPGGGATDEQDECVDDKEKRAASRRHRRALGEQGQRNLADWKDNGDVQEQARRTCQESQGAVQWQDVR